MAMTRKFLKEVLADRSDRDELIDQIIDAHIETVAVLKAEVDKYSEDVENVRNIELEISRLKESSNRNDSEWKAKYEMVKAEFDAAKETDKKREERKEKEAAFREILASEGVKPEFFNLAVRANAGIIDGMEMQMGRVRNRENVAAAIRNECSGFIAGKMNQATTKAEIRGIKNRDERLAAMSANPYLFQ